MSQIVTSDIDTEIAAGNYGDREWVCAFGEREDMAVDARGEDICRFNELSAVPAALSSDAQIPTPSILGTAMAVISEHANDTIAGVGTQKVNVDYIQAGTGLALSETVEMNGTTAVPLVNTDIAFINDIYTNQVGTNGVAVGHIRIYEIATPANVFSMIASGGNQAMMPHKMVPGDKTLILKGWHCEEAQNRRVNVRIRSTDRHGELLSGIFCFKDVAYVRNTTSGWLPLNIKVPAWSVVKISGWVDFGGSGDTEVSCGWAGILIKN